MKENNKIKVYSQVESVRVYRNGAMLSSRYEVNLSEGINLLEIDGLSPMTDDVRVFAETNSDAVIVSQWTALSNNGGEREIQANKLFIEAQEEADRAEVLLNLTESEIGLLNDNRNLHSHGDSAQIEVFEKYYLKRVKALLKKKAEQNRELLICREKVQKLWNEKERQAARKAKKVFVKIKANRDEKAEIKLSYFVGGLTWTPCYEVRSEGENTPLSFKLKASINNECGENLKNVSLACTTASPEFNRGLPVFEPEYVSAARPQIMARAAMLSAPAPVFADTAESQTERSFLPKGRFDLFDGAKNFSLLLLENTLPAVYGYQCMAYAEQAVLFTAAVPLKLPVPSAPAALFLNGEYCCTTELSVSNEEKTVLCFGLDDGIKVERKQQPGRIQKTDDGKEKSLRKYTITLKNCKNKPVEVNIVDRLPVSMHSDITVETVIADGAAFNKETGRLEWKVTLQPDEKKSVTAEAAVVTVLPKKE